MLKNANYFNRAGGILKHLVVFSCYINIDKCGHYHKIMIKSFNLFGPDFQLR